MAGLWMNDGANERGQSSEWLEPTERLNYSHSQPTTPSTLKSCVMTAWRCTISSLLFALGRARGSPDWLRSEGRSLPVQLITDILGSDLPCFSLTGLLSAYAAPRLSRLLSLERTECIHLLFSSSACP